MSELNTPQAVCMGGPLDGKIMNATGHTLHFPTKAIYRLQIINGIPAWIFKEWKDEGA